MIHLSFKVMPIRILVHFFALLVVYHSSSSALSTNSDREDLQLKLHSVRQSHADNLTSSDAQKAFADILQPSFKSFLEAPDIDGIDKCLSHYHTLTCEDERRVTLAILLNQLDWHKDQAFIGQTQQDPTTLISDYQKIMALGPILDEQNPEISLGQPDWGPPGVPMTLRLKCLDGYGYTVISLALMCLEQCAPTAFTFAQPEHVSNIRIMLACLPDTFQVKQNPRQVGRSAIQAISDMQTEYPTLFQALGIDCNPDFLTFLEFLVAQESAA